MEYNSPDRRPMQLAAFGRLLDVLERLRAECPWDRKQTLESLRHLTIEETYELSDAIIRHDLPDLKKELGDVFLHLIFYAKIASETGHFDVADVLNAQCEKLIFRHPHIYGNVKAEDEETVKRNWEQLKLKEKGNTSVLGGVPTSLPALVKAMRIQEKARGAGFDWEKPEQVWDKVQEELGEFQAEFAHPDPSSINQERAAAEFGDLLFSLINFARHAGINPEEALERTNRKFINRFQYLETQAAHDGHQLRDLTLSQMDVYWEQAKKYNFISKSPESKD
ncbi:nucleoside triphosphate pyrophosphohydrolase [Hymenobacter sp. BT186]|uniref:Nucleoside triphosphate pyrophosphohydrolase n=1 Tax=Hymenobacter telluris TaxID=2816474 RepID=A0A939EZD0_9BACT|nr:nucleoside triphosphate pyrophosphohydrolase [Hymenobacter telluris]MBO0359901.1 nucleoside triphosphate pyrophosphohydrolase [Hymenobacter telluris]MBW3375928.1 nucleoside triphosphate pyrophosphohydrolase [Hymenobacter norwichensis]